MKKHWLLSIIQRIFYFLRKPQCTLLLQHNSQVMCVTVCCCFFMYHISFNHYRTYKSYSSQGDTLNICERLLTQITAPLFLTHTHIIDRPTPFAIHLQLRAKVFVHRTSRALLHFIEFIEHNIHGLWLISINAMEMHASQIIYSKVNCLRCVPQI